MNRRQAMVYMAAGTALMDNVATATVGSGNLSHRVRELADRYAAAWNASDMTAMAELYADAVHWVNIVGMHWRGKHAVDKAHRAFFDSMFKGVPLTLQEIESIQPLPGRACIAVIRWSVGSFRTPGGQIVPPSRDRMTLVLVPDHGRLRIAHGANIQIDELAQGNDPIAADR